MSKFIANKIKKLRKSAGWSQSELARQAGVTSATISMIEKGDRNPSLDISRKIAYALNISVNELTGNLPSSLDINDEAQAFYRKFKGIKELSIDDQGLILSLVKRLKNNWS